MNYFKSYEMVSEKSQLVKDDYTGILIVSDNQEVINICITEGIAVAGYDNGEGTSLSCENILMDIDEIEKDDFERIYRRCMGIPWDIAKTERTYIREFSMEDLDKLFELYQKPGMTTYMENLFEYEAEKEYEQNYINFIYKMYGYGQWLVFDKSTDELIGRAGIESRETCQVNEVEIGYAIASNRWREGLAYEVCSKIIELAKDEYGLSSIIARTDPKNNSSRKLLEKLGFSQVEILPDGDYKFYKKLS